MINGREQQMVALI